MKFSTIKLGGRRRIWTSGKRAVFFVRGFDGTESYAVGNYNAAAKDWNTWGTFATPREARAALATAGKGGPGGK